MLEFLERKRVCLKTDLIRNIHHTLSLACDRLHIHWPVCPVAPCMQSSNSSSPRLPAIGQPFYCAPVVVQAAHFFFYSSAPPPDPPGILGVDLFFSPLVSISCLFWRCCWGLFEPRDQSVCSVIVCLFVCLFHLLLVVCDVNSSRTVGCLLFVVCGQ